MKNKHWKDILWAMTILSGCALFAAGFDVFLEPNGINDGGLSGLIMVIVHLTGFGTVGKLMMLVNVPLFIIGGTRLGKRFFVGSLIGAVGLSAFLELFTLLPSVPAEPLLAALYGGVLCGGGIGLVFLTGASTGGSDIIIRLMKLYRKNSSIGHLVFGFDLTVVLLTGLAFRDMSTILYCGITLYVASIVLDAVVYRLDYSKVALIISDRYEEITGQIWEKLDRGVTYLEGEGAYHKKPTKIILVAIKRQQLAELKELVSSIDPDAFIILQESHQILGNGFAHYQENAL